MSKECTGIAERFAIILNALSENEKVKISYLEELTGYDRRNLQKDLNERLKWVFGIETDNRGNYWMDKKYRGLFTLNEIKSYSKILGTSEILPQFDYDFLSKLIKNKSQRTFIIDSPYKDGIKNSPDFKTISNAIDDLKGLFFRYNNKSYSVYPYRMKNTNGHWYLCAMHGDKLKTFKLNKLLGVRVNSNSFKMDQSILDTIETSDTIWMSNSKPIVIKLKISNSFVDYFQESIIIPGETGRQWDDDNSLIVTIEASVYEEIKNIVKYWIPRIEVMEPKELRDIIRSEILEYAESCK